MEAITNVSVPVVPKQGKAQAPLKRASDSDAKPLPKPEAAKGQTDKLTEVSAKLERARQVANTHVLGNHSVVTFKDAATGKNITRITNLEDGSEVYLPRPDALARMHSIDKSLSLDA